MLTISLGYSWYYYFLVTFSLGHIPSGEKKALQISCWEGCNPSCQYPWVLGGQRRLGLVSVLSRCLQRTPALSHCWYVQPVTWCTEMHVLPPWRPLLSHVCGSTAEGQPDCWALRCGLRVGFACPVMITHHLLFSFQSGF